MTESEARAFAVALKNRLARVQPGAQSVALQLPAPVVNIPTPQIHMPPPQVTNEVYPAEVHVRNEVQPTPVAIDMDTGPIAAAIDRMAETVVQAVRAMTDAVGAVAEMQGQLIQVLASERAIEFRPNITLPESSPSITVEAPSVTVEAPVSVEMPVRPKRRIVIKHDDGTTSTVTEE